MKATSTAKVKFILSLLDSGKDGCAAAASAHVSPSTVTRLCKKHRSSLLKSVGGRPPKLSTANIHHAMYLIQTGKAEKCCPGHQTTSGYHQPTSVYKNCLLWIEGCWDEVVRKKKRPFLSKRHRRARLDWALAHQHWTMEDWKTNVYTDESKINCFGSDGGRMTWKMVGEP